MIVPGSLYIAAPKAGKSYLMRAHVNALRAQPGAPFFFVVDHDDTWGPESMAGASLFADPAAWWANPSPLAVFRGVPGATVAQLAIDVGWSVYVDDECDDALEGWKDGPLREIVKRGRHLRNRGGHVTQVGAMLATHRPANLPQDVIGCFDRVYLGRIQGIANAERAFREGWVRADNAFHAREVLESRATGEFTAWP